MGAFAEALLEPMAEGQLPGDWPSWAELQEWNRERQDAWLVKTVQDRLGITVPSVAVCPGHDAPLDALADVFFERELDAIWWGSRGSGKTYELAILTWLESNQKPRLETVVIGGSLKQASNCYRYTTEQFWPRSLMARAMLAEEPTKSQTLLRNGSRYEIIASSTRSARSPHPQRLRIDEADELDETVYRAVIQTPMRFEGYAPGTVITSTRQRPHGLMQTVLDEAEERHFRVYSWCYKEVAQQCRYPDEQCSTCELLGGCGGGASGLLRKSRGYYPISDLREKKRKLDSGSWAAEWECGAWQQLGGRIYQTAHLEPATEQIVRWQPGQPVWAGIDWGLENPTVLVIAQDAPDDAVEIFYARYWHGVGLEERIAQITDDLRAYGVSDVYADAAGADENQMLETRMFAVTRVPFQQDKRSSIIAIRSHLERGKLRISGDLDEFIREMETYSADPKNDEPIKKNDHGPDALAALMKRKHAPSATNWWQDPRTLCIMAGLIDEQGTLLVKISDVTDPQRKLLASANIAIGVN